MTFGGSAFGTTTYGSASPTGIAHPPAPSRDSIWVSTDGFERTGVQTATTNDYRRVVGDTDPPIEDTLVAGDRVLDVSGATVEFHLTKPDGETITADTSGAVTVDDAEGGEVRYTFQSGDLDQQGRYLYEWEVTYADGSVVTLPGDSERKIWVRDELA